MKVAKFLPWKIHFTKIVDGIKRPFCGNVKAPGNQYYMSNDWKEITCKKCNELRYK